MPSKNEVDSPSPVLSSISTIIEELQAKRMVILVDDPSRENEGDLYIPAQNVTAASINFMARYGRGLICLALENKRVEHLGLSLMSPINRSRRQTAFTTSIEARHGITTGISAADRACTIREAIDPKKGRDDIVSPGHVFPLVARQGGVLVRAGHTEAAVDLSQAAMFDPSGVICEIMNDDGTMARLPDLEKFRRRHNLKMASIADLIAWRLKRENFIEAQGETTFHSDYGGPFRMILYVNQLQYAEHIALVCGDISDDQPVAVRVHTVDFLGDVLAQKGWKGAGSLQRAMKIVTERGRGVILLIREPRPTFLSQKINAAENPAHKHDNEEATTNLREYGIGAQILRHLGVRDMILLSDTKRAIVGIEGYNLRVVGHQSLRKSDHDS